MSQIFCVFATHKNYTKYQNVWFCYGCTIESNNELQGHKKFLTCRNAVVKHNMLNTQPLLHDDKKLNW